MAFLFNNVLVKWSMATEGKGHGITHTHTHTHTHTYTHTNLFLLPTRLLIHNISRDRQTTHFDTLTHTLTHKQTPSLDHCSRLCQVRALEQRSVEHTSALQSH